MRKLLPLTFLVAAFVLPIKIGLLSGACGGSNIQLSAPRDDGGGSQPSTNCDDTGATVTTGTMTAQVTGEPCNAPSPSALENNDIILDCTDPEPGRDTTDPDADFVTITCGQGDGAAQANYFCVDGVVFKDDGNSGNELFGSITVACTVDSEGNGSLSEEELIIS